MSDILITTEQLEELRSMLKDASGLSSEIIPIVKAEDGGSGTLDTSKLSEAREAFQTKLAKVKTDALKGAEDKTENMVNKAVKNNSEKWESNLRKQFEEIDQSISGDELISAIAQAKGMKADLSTATTEEIKKLPIYSELIKEQKKHADEELQKVTGEFDTFKKGIESEKGKAKLWELGQGIAMKLNPVISDNEAVKKNQLARLRDLTTSIHNRIESDGSVTLLKEDGEPLVDDNANPISYESYVTRLVGENFDLKQHSKKDGLKDGKPVDGGTSWNKAIPKTEAEYISIVRNKEVPLEERKALQTAWEGRETETA